MGYGRSPSDLQRSFLDADVIDVELVQSTLLKLGARDDTSSLHLWIAMAVLHVLTEPTLTLKIADLAALEALLRASNQAVQALSAAPAGISTSSATKSTSQAAQTQCRTMSDVFHAWQKTGMIIESLSSSTFSLTAQGNDEDEDEEASWFDADHGTPSPGPSAPPSILLSTLAASLSQPIRLAIALAPYPQRLAIWLKGLSPSTYLIIYPQRLEVLGQGLAHHAMAADDGTYIQDLQREGLLPSIDEQGVESSLWNTPRSQSSGDSGDKRISDILSFYVQEARELESTFDASELAAALVDAAPKVSSPDDATSTALKQLEQIREELMISRLTGSSDTRPAGQSSSSLRIFVNEPASTIASRLQNLDQTSQLLELANRKTGRSRDDIAREVCWKRLELDQAASPALSAFIESVCDGNERSRVVCSVLLSSRNGEGLARLLPLLESVPSSEPTTKKTLPAGLLHTLPSLKLSTDGRLPSKLPTTTSAAAIYSSLGDADALVLAIERCRIYLETLSKPAAKLLSSLPPWLLAVTTGSGFRQIAVLQRILSSQSTSSTSRQKQDRAEHSQQLLDLAGAGRLLDSLDGPAVVGEVLRDVLLRGDIYAFQPILEAHQQVYSLTPIWIESLLLQVAREIFDQAPGGRSGVAELKRVRSCLELAQQPSPRIKSSLAFLTSTLRLMQLPTPLPSSLHPSVVMAPLEVRLAENKLEIIRKWLSGGNDGAWKREEDVLETAIGLCGAVIGDGSLGDPRDITSEATLSNPVPSSTTQKSDRLIKVQVLAMLADCAISHHDLTHTDKYVDSMLQTLKDLIRRARRAGGSTSSSTTSATSEVKQAQELVWTTLFSLSKHPYCMEGTGGEEMTRRWLVEAVAFAPSDRLSDLLKRWRNLEPSEGQGIIDKASTAMTRDHRGGGSIHSSAAAAQDAAAGLSAGVFGLASAAVNSSRWPLSLSSTLSRGGAAHNGLPSEAGQSSGLAASLGSTGVGNALSSLAGQFGEGYGSRLTGLLGGGSHLSSAVAHSDQAPRSSSDIGRGRTSSDMNPGNTTSSEQPSTNRSAASLFDGLGQSSSQHRTSSPFSAGESGRTASPSQQHTGYLDPAERAARAARGFLSGWTGGGTNGDRRDSSGSRSRAPEMQAVGGGSGWAALSSRGMGWLMGDEEGEGEQ